MKKTFSKAAALLIATLLMLSATGCFSTAALIYKTEHRRGSDMTRNTDFFGTDEDDDDSWHKATPTPRDSKRTEPTDRTDPTDPTTPPDNGGKGNGAGILTDPSNGLTYPDGIATQDIIHPSRAKGTVTGDEAKKILDDVEKKVLNEVLSSYVDAEIYFADYSKYGITPDGYGWGEYTTDNDTSLDKELLDKLYSIDPDSLSDSDRIFYDKIVYDLEEDVYYGQFTAFPYFEMEFDPLVGPQNDILFILDILEFENKQDAEHYIEVLKDIDRYFDQICAFEKQRCDYGYAASPDVYEDTAESFDALVAQKNDCFLYDSFKERLGKISGLSESDRQDLIARHDKAMKEVVFPEFEECAKAMRDLKSYKGSNKGLSQFPGGREYYECVFRQQTNSSKSVKDATADLDRVIENLKTTKNDLMKNYMSWYMEYALHSYDKGGVKKNLDFLADAVKADFPDIPQHAYKMMDVPEVFEDSFSPAAFIGYHLDRNDSNVIIVNNGSSKSDLGVVLAHEGYPGHMFQSLYTRNGSDHPYMYLFESIGYAEGWAVYSENYAMKYFDDNPDVVTFCQVENEWNSLLTARCDIGIHCEDWTIKDCVKLFTSLGLSVTKESFSDYYNLLLSDPCYSSKYGVGFVNTGIVMSRMKSEFPNASDKEIHTAFLNAQTGTFEQIEEHMRRELSKKN